MLEKYVFAFHKILLYRKVSYNKTSVACVSVNHNYRLGKFTFILKPKPFGRYFDMKFAIIFLIICILNANTWAFLKKFQKRRNGYRPVILLHGVGSGGKDMEPVKARIQQKHPGTLVYNIYKFDYQASFENLWKQVEEIGQDIMKFSKNYPEGVHLIGLSQGALLTRVILQAFPEHNVKHYLSLAGPQAGDYGISSVGLLSYGSPILSAVSEFLYSEIGKGISIANYWKDPHDLKSYYRACTFLPYVNNEISSPKSQQYKEGLIKLEKMVLFGSPADGTITPWQSSHFAFYGNNTEDVIALKESPLYKEDRIGLRTLDESGRLDIVTAPNVKHGAWLSNASNVDEYILPYLN